MINRIWIGGLMVGMLPALTMAAHYVNDFSTDIVGNRPAGLDYTLAPPLNIGNNSADGDIGIVTVGSSAIGGGNAMRLYDRSSSSVQARAFFAPITSGIVSLNFTLGDYGGDLVALNNTYIDNGNARIGIALGNASVTATSSSNGSTFMRLNITRDSTTPDFNGQFRYNNNNSGAFTETTINDAFIETNNNLVEIFFNRTSETILYTKSGSQSVAANTYDAYLNGILLANDAPMRTTTPSVSGIAFGSPGSQVGADWIVDNILVVNGIPEPATLGLLTIGSLALLSQRRRRA